MSFFGFHFEITINFWTFILTLAYLAAMAGGYYLIASQVKLVKKEVWATADKIKCFLYGFFFANGVIIIIAMMVTFATASNYQNTGIFIIIPLIFCLIFIALFPIFDFLNMAHSKEEDTAMTPLQELIEQHIFNKFRPPLSYIIAVLLYLLIFIVPPMILNLVVGIDFIIVWMSWLLIFPMTIVTFYGAKGYITGLVGFYTQIPRPARSMFLFFDQSNRASIEFYRTPVQRIFTGVMLFFYFWTFYSLVTTVVRIDPNGNTSGFNTMQYSFSVYIVLILGITGYFTRFWGRKIKFKTMDILFAAFLIAAVGVNVLVNFTLVNIEKLEIAFSEWDMTAAINEEWVVNDFGQSVGNFRMFALAAVIEEVVLVILISFYFFEKKHQFINDTVYAEVTLAGDNFNPTPPFNLARSHDKHQREHAYSILLTIYGRIPNKMGYSLMAPEIKDPLLDALGDNNQYALSIAKKILLNLMENYPKETLPLIIEGLKSPNYDKAIVIIKIIAQKGEKVIEILPIDLIYRLIKHNEYHMRKYAIQMLQKYYSLHTSEKPSQQEIQVLINLLNDPDYEIVGSNLEFLSHFPEKVPQNIFTDRLNHHHPEIKSIAAAAVGNVETQDLSKATVPSLVEMLQSRNPKIKSAVMDALAKIGEFAKNNIPYEPFIQGLIEQNESIRNAALKGALIIIKENSDNTELLNYILNIDSYNIEIQRCLLKMAAENSHILGDKGYALFFKFLHSEDNQLKQIASKGMVELSIKDPVALIKRLLSEKETESVIKRGMISQTLIDVVQKNATIGMPILIEKLSSSDENAKINAASALAALSEKHLELIPIKQIVPLWLSESSNKVKKELTKVFSNVASSEPAQLKPLMPMVTKGLSDSNTSVRKSIAKMFAELAEKTPSLIPMSAVHAMLKDTESSVREASMNILSYIGPDFPKESIELIKIGLNDSEWDVKNAAAEAIAHIGEHVENPEIGTEIRKLLQDSSRWVRLKALEIISKVVEKQQNIISLPEVLKIIKQGDIDETMLIAGVKLLGVVASQNFDAAFQEMITFLEHPNEKVREGMISGMTKLSGLIPVKEYVPKLLAYLSDETELIIQQSIAILLKKIVKYESEAIKTRVISLLKIRCQMSQDPIICEALSELQN